MNGVTQLDRIRLNCRDPEALARFYVAGLGFRNLPEDNLVGTPVRRLQLGGTRLDLVASPSGRPYPHDVSGDDVRFQHIALAIPDMAVACKRLATMNSWRAISTEGPVRLPAASGGVVAFKFRDPEGHPLEFLNVPGAPPGGAARIDHSAISVSDTFSSLTFYESLGLRVSGGSVNRGAEQTRLDGLSAVAVEVSALQTPAQAPPHVELLCYRPRLRGTKPAEPQDIAATRLIFAVSDQPALDRLAAALSPRLISRSPSGAALVRDPDGHLLEFEVEP